MNNKKLKVTDSKKYNFKKIPKLKPLKLEQLEGLAGGWAKPGHFE